MNAIRRRSLFSWLGFAFFWGLLFVASTWMGAEACSGDGGEPYAKPGSTLDRYCGTVDSTLSGHYFVVWLVAPVVVALGGVVGLALGLRRIVHAGGALLVAASVVHAGLSLALPAN